jgi:dihydroceramidase
MPETGFSQVTDCIQVILDELPMIYAATQALYCVIAQGKPTTLTLRLGCTFIPIFITITYLLFPNPVYHQTAYAAIVLSTTWKQYILGKTLPRQSSLYKDTLYILKSGVVLMITAFAIWNLDNLFCEGITDWRARVPVSQ